MKQKIKIRSEVNASSVKVFKILAEMKDTTMYKIIGNILDEYAKTISLQDLSLYENKTNNE
jgi:hypothetical protein